MFFTLTTLHLFCFQEIYWRPRILEIEPSYVSINGTTSVGSDEEDNQKVDDGEEDEDDMNVDQEIVDSALNEIQDTTDNSDASSDEEHSALVNCCVSPLTNHAPVGNSSVVSSLDEEPVDPDELAVNGIAVEQKTKYQTKPKPKKPKRPCFQDTADNSDVSSDEEHSAIVRGCVSPQSPVGNSAVVSSLDEEPADPDELAVNGIAVEQKTKSQTKSEPKKPKRPCVFCDDMSSRLPRHILSIHKHEPLVKPLLRMNRKEQLYRIAGFRREGIQKYNLKIIDEGVGELQRERTSAEDDVPFMCSGCYGFFSKSYTARHRKVCPALGNNCMIPVRALDQVKTLAFDDLDKDFKELLNDLRLDEIGNYVKGDLIIIMIGIRTFDKLKKKKDKKKETKRTVRGRMRLLGRLYLGFKKLYAKQSEVSLPQVMNNAGDMFHRDAMLILGKTINKICEKEGEFEDDDVYGMLKEKNGLKIVILNLLILAGKYLIGYYLMKRKDDSAKEVVDFLKVLRYYEDDLFGDAYYALGLKKNVTTKKAKSLASEEDVGLIYEECYSAIDLIDSFTFVGEKEFVKVRTSTATSLTLFNARRGGEPVRLVISQWFEALNGDWVDEEDRENDDADLVITFQTG